MEQQVVWYILSPFIPPELESELGKEIVFSRIILPLLGCVAGVSFQAPQAEWSQLTSRVPTRTSHPTFVHKEWRKPKGYRKNGFLSQHLGSLLPFPWGKPCWKFASLISLATGNGWQHHGIPWGTGEGDISQKSRGILWRSFQPWGIFRAWRRLGWVPSSDFWGSGWLGDFQALRQQEGMISKGDLNFQGDKMISCWKEKHQKIIGLMIYEALCCVFVFFGMISGLFLQWCVFFSISAK